MIDEPQPPEADPDDDLGEEEAGGRPREGVIARLRIRTALRRFWWLGLAIVIVCAAVPVILNELRPATYEATASVLVSPTQKLRPDLAGTQDVIPSLAKQSETATLEAETERDLRPRLRGRDWTVDVIGDPSRLTLWVKATSEDEDVVVPVANAYAREIVLSSLGPGGLGNDLVRFKLLDRAVEPVATGFDSRQLGALGLLLGLVLAAAAMLMAQALRPSARRPADLRRRGIAVVGEIPEEDGLLPPARVFAADGAAADAYGRAAVAVEAARERAGVPSVAVLSLDAGEGASAVAAGLAWASASMGNRVAVVDGDLAAPQVHRRLGLDIAGGLADGGEPREVPGAPPGLRAIVAGSRAANPLETVTARLPEAIAAIDEAGATAVVDTPALGAGAGAVAIASLAGAAVLVVRAGRHRPDAVEAAVAELEELGIVVLGVILTGQPTPRHRPRAVRPEPDRRAPSQEPATPGQAVAATAGAHRPHLPHPHLPHRQGPSRAQKTVRNAGYVFVQIGLAPLLNILLLPILVRELGAVEYGVFATLQALFIFNTLLDLGLGKSVTRYTSAFFAEGRFEDISRFISTSFTMFLGMGVLALGFASLVAAFGLEILNVPADLQDQAQIVCLMFGCMAVYNLPSGTLGAAMAGLKQHRADSRLLVGIAIAQFVGQAAVALSGLGLVAVAAAFHIPNLARPWGRIPIIRRMVPGFRLSPRLFSKAMLREFTGYSVWAFFIDSGRRVTESSGPVLVSAFFGPAIATPYSIGLQVGRFLQRLTLPIAFVLLPVAAELDAKGDRAASRRLVLRSTRYSSALALGLSVPLILMADNVIRVWLGEPFPLAVDVSRLFLIVSILIMSRAPLTNVLEGNKLAVRRAGVVTLSETVLNIVLGIALLIAIGARGAVLGTVIAISLGTVFGIAPMALRQCEIRPMEFLKVSIFPNLIPLALSFPVWLAAAWLIDGRGLIVVLAGLGVSVAVYFAILWRTLPARDREELGGPLMRKLGVRRAPGAARSARAD